MLSRALAPHCSGLLGRRLLRLLVDGRRPRRAAAAPGYSSASRRAGADKNKRRRPVRRRRTRLERRQNQALRGGRGQTPGAVRAGPSSDSAEKNFAFVRRTYEQCVEHDILFLLEPLHFAFNGDDAKSDAVLNRKPTTVIESARILSRYCDVYKAEFPGTYGYGSRTRCTMDNLKRLERRLCTKPWVLLKCRREVPGVQEAGRDGDEGRVQQVSSAGGRSGPSSSRSTRPRPRGSTSRRPSAPGGSKNSTRSSGPARRGSRSTATRRSRPGTTCAPRKAGTPGTAAARPARGRGEGRCKDASVLSE